MGSQQVPDEGANVCVNVGQQTLERVMAEQIKAAIVTGLGEERRQQIIGDVVQRMLTQRVDSEGRVSRNSYSNQQTLIEWLFADVCRKAARAALTEWLEENQDKLKRELYARLTEQRRAMADALVKGLVECTSSSWYFNCDVKFKTRDRE